MKQCPNCGASLRPGFARCVKCGTAFESSGPPPGVLSGWRLPRLPRQKDPTLAAALSCILVGLGQVYNGQIGKAILMFAFCVALWFVLLGWIVNLVAIIDAYRTAKKINAGTLA